jgi:hypothetical protein
MSRNNFWRNFWGETGRNSGKWVSNKVFGDAGWATPRRHIFSNDSGKIQKIAKKALDDFPESVKSTQNDTPKTVIKKNVATNEHDVKIAEMGNKTISETFHRQTKENKFSIWLVVGIISVLFILIFGLYNYNNNIRISDEELQLKLESTELQINILLKEGKKEEASALIFKLMHPSEKPMPNNGTVNDWLNPKTYNNHWMEKRAYYIELIQK